MICIFDNQLIFQQLTDAETKDVKALWFPVSSLFGGEEYVKMIKADWNRIVNVFHKAAEQNRQRADRAVKGSGSDALGEEDEWNTGEGGGGREGGNCI